MTPQEAARTRRFVRIAAAGGLVLLVSGFFHAIVPVNPTTIGFAYLITILLIAAWWGLSPSIAASITATVCLNFFFLPPTLTLSISDPGNWIALTTFLVCSLVASQLSDRAQRRTAEAIQRQTEMERLYALSRALMLVSPTQPVAFQIVEKIAGIYETPFAAIHDRRANELHVTGDVSVERIPQLPDLLREAAETGGVIRDLSSAALIASITLGGQSIGSLAIQEKAVSSTALNALLNLVAITLENARIRDLATRSEAARQSEEFKSGLLDGLAHEFKTPLTSIKAAASALLTSAISAPEQRDELLTIVDQEADRLSRLVTETLQLARIEAGKIQLNFQPCSVRRLLEGAIQQMETARNNRPIELIVDDAVTDILADIDLLQLALRQLLDNALKYSHPRSPILIRAHPAGENVEIAVRSTGEVLSQSEQQRVFEKFYRGKDVRNRVAGTGMGLAIARQILVAHGGAIRVESDRDGTEFIAAAPAVRVGIHA